MSKRIVEIDDGVWIYLPHGLTPEQETKVIAHYLGSFEPEAFETDCREMIRRQALGASVRFSPALPPGKL